MNISNWGTALLVLLLAGCADDPGGAPVNTPCSTNTDCADRVCHNGSCAASEPKKEGQACQGDGDCESYNCLGGVCRTGKLLAGAGCIRSAECVSGLCGSTGACVGPKPDGGKPDAGASDAPTRDAPVQDKPVPDRLIPDKPVPDKLPPDKPLPDKLIPDKLQPDTYNPCGNGKLDPTEVCDGKLMGGKTCGTQGFTVGTIACHANCSLDTRACVLVKPLSGYLHSTTKMAYLTVAAGANNFLAAWEGAGRIYAATVPKSGVAGKVFPLATTTLDRMPDAATDGNNYLVGWAGNNYQVRGTRVTPTGVVLDPLSFTITSDGRAPALAFDGTSYLATFAYGPSDRNYARRITTAGVPKGGHFAVGSASLSRHQAVARGSGGVLAVWAQSSAGIRGRLVAQSGPLGAKDFVIDGGKNQTYYWPAVAYAGGRYLVLWEDRRSGVANIVGAVLDSAGKVLKKVIIISGMSSTAAKSKPVVATDGSRFLVLWLQGGGIHGTQVLVDSKGAQVVHDPAPALVASGATGYMDLAYGTGQFMMVWLQYKGGPGGNHAVWATRLSFGK